MTSAPTGLHRHVPHRHAPHRHRLPAAAAVVLALAALVVALLVHEGVFRSSSGPAAVEGSGIAASQARRVAAFTGVDLAGSNDVTVRVGGQRSVVVHADDNLLDRVTTQVHGGRLVIGDVPGSFTTRSPMRVEVVTPSLLGLTLDGSGVVVASGVDAPSFTVTLRGSGVLRASGTAGSLRVSVPGSGDAELSALVARDVDASIGGSGRIVVTPTGSLRASVSGSGAVIYGGSPASVATSVTGSGAVIRG